MILVEPENISQEGKKILDSLQGDVARLAVKKFSGLTETMNLAARKARGKSLVFLQPDLVPFLFGARILDERGSLLHAGMVVDMNNSPVPAYPYLEPEFACAMKERPFQMLDYVLCMDRSVFCQLGGFVPQAGKFAFMDLCLRANQSMGKDSCMYLPQVCLISQAMARNPYMGKIT